MKLLRIFRCAYAKAALENNRRVPIVVGQAEVVNETLCVEPTGASRSALLTQAALIGFGMLLMVLQILKAWSDAPGTARGTQVAQDFKAFYCAGATSNAGADPYLEIPFQRCGAARRMSPPSFARAGVNPAPFPPYDIPLFKAFALLPYRLAAELWLALSCVATLFVVFAIAKVARLPALLVFVALALPLFLTSASLGQLPPIVAASLCVAVLAIRCERFAVVGTACTASLLEPHLGLPAWLAVALCIPKARIALFATTAILGLVGVAAVGFPTNIAYLSTILPLEAASNIVDAGQYSLTWLLYTAGISANIALIAGSMSYIVMTALGVLISRAAVERTGAKELYILIPVAASLLGGPHLHITQLALALPCALVLVQYVGGASRRVLWLAIVVLSVIWWTQTWEVHPWSTARLESIFIAGILVFTVVRASNIRHRVLNMLLVVSAYVAITMAVLATPELALRPAESAAVFAGQIGSGAQYTTGRMGIEERQGNLTGSASSLRALVYKLPTWLALVIVLGVLGAWLRSRRTTGPTIIAS